MLLGKDSFSIFIALGRGCLRGERREDSMGLVSESELGDRH